MKLDTQNLRCVYCGHHGLDIYQQTPTCAHCGHVFPTFDGIRFLGSYHKEDTLGLIEVSSKISQQDDPSAVRQRLNSAETRLREKYEQVYVDRTVTPASNYAPGSNEMAQAVRLREWAGFELLSEEFDFEGKTCLGMGGGLRWRFRTSHTSRRRCGVHGLQPCVDQTGFSRRPRSTMARRQL